MFVAGSFEWIGWVGREVRGFTSYTFAPESAASPAITGVVATGEELTCHPGTWRNAPDA